MLVCKPWPVGISLSYIPLITVCFITIANVTFIFAIWLSNKYNRNNHSNASQVKVPVFDKFLILQASLDMITGNLMSVYSFYTLQEDIYLCVTKRTLPLNVLQIAYGIAITLSVGLTSGISLNRFISVKIH